MKILSVVIFVFSFLSQDGSPEYTKPSVKAPRRFGMSRMNAGVLFNSAGMMNLR
jgi:hypothetical protein